MSDIIPLDREESIILHLDKKVEDRTNIILAVNAFLFNIYLPIVTAEHSPGLLFLVPILISIAGILLNIIVSILNQKQMEKIKELSLRHPKLDYKTSIEDFFNFWTPRFLIVIWLICLIVSLTLV